ncbi:hypothetical protein BJV78DRAFT_1157007 [Lactifluus subvellereus]|nr:hypothetical protein BJV78DRAFT_1157007 [Lactifluus subvellereus]
MWPSFLFLLEKATDGYHLGSGRVVHPSSCEGVPLGPGDRDFPIDPDVSLIDTSRTNLLRCTSRGCFEFLISNLPPHNTASDIPPLYADVDDVDGPLSLILLGKAGTSLPSAEQTPFQIWKYQGTQRSSLHYCKVCTVAPENARRGRARIHQVVILQQILQHEHPLFLY